MFGTLVFNGFKKIKCKIFFLWWLTNNTDKVRERLFFG